MQKNAGAALNILYMVNCLDISITKAQTGVLKRFVTAKHPSYQQQMNRFFKCVSPLAEELIPETSPLFLAYVRDNSIPEFRRSQTIYIHNCKAHGHMPA